MSTKERILQYIQKYGTARPTELANHFEVTTQAIHLQLKKLLREMAIEKVGEAPKTYYRLRKKLMVSPPKGVYQAGRSTERKVKDFYTITPNGEILEGFKGFRAWCQQRSLSVKKSVEEYVAVQKKYRQFRKGGLIDGTNKMQTTFDNSILKKLVYADFYSIEKFGKTKLGQQLLYAKAGENESLVYEVVQQVLPKIHAFAKKKKVDAIALVPHTIPRSVQVMNVLRDSLEDEYKILPLEKAYSGERVPQKTLKKLEDRITNAEGTIFVRELHAHKRILLVDDAVGSGASMQVVSKKILQKSKVQSIIFGFAFVGSLKGFEVISEV